MRVFICLMIILSSGLQANASFQSQGELLRKDYDELQKSFHNNLKIYETASKYAKAFLIKAKANNDKIKIADGYHHFFMINPPEIAMKYVDSIIELTKNSNHINYPSRGYLNKGVLLENDKKFNEAFDYYLKAKRYAELNNNEIHQVAIALNIAQLKLSMGKIDEALSTYRSNYDFLQTKDIKKSFFRPYIGTLVRMSIIYNRKKKLDSARIYINEGIERVTQSSEAFNYSALLLCSGVNDYYKENYQKAIDSLKKISNLELKLEGDTDKGLIDLYLAKSYLKINNKEKAFIFLKRIDSSVTINNYSPRLREAFELLLTGYKENNVVDKQLEVLEKLIAFDSISNFKNDKLGTAIYRDYNTQQFKAERSQLIKKLENQKSNVTYIIVCLALVIIFFSFLIYRGFKKRQEYKKKFDLLMNNREQEPVNKPLKEPEKAAVKVKEKKVVNDLPDKIVEEIIEKLDRFESDNKFIDSKMTLAKLAKMIKTNSSYLSKVINDRKGQNFTNYLNDLRVDFVIEKLKNDPTFRRYTIQSIGEEIGFNNIQSFSKAFQKKTGLKPSYFVKMIDNQ